MVVAKKKKKPKKKKTKAKKKPAKKKTTKKKSKAKPKSRRPKQQELLKVKRDKVGRAAAAYLKARDILADAKEDVIEKALKLVKLLRDAKRKEIKVEGTIITLRHVESQDLLRVKKPRE
jgi:hypothetical protein